MFETLRGKIALGYLVLASLIILVSVFSLNHIERLTSSINKIMAENYRSVTAAERMIMAIERQDSSVLLYLLGHNEQVISDFHTAQSEFIKWLGRAEDNITLANEDEVVDRIDDLYKEYTGAFGRLRVLDTDERFDYYIENLLPVFRSIEDEVEELLTMNHDSMLSARKSSDELGRRAVFSTLAVGATALLVAAGASFYISSLIVNPTQELSDLIRSIEPGNIGRLEAAEYPGEIGVLAKEVNEMILRLKRYDERLIDQLQGEKERSQAIVESITDGILVVDDEYRLQIANQTARNLFELPSARIEGHILERLDDDRVYEALKETIENAKTVERRGPDNRWIGGNEDRKKYYELVVSPVFKKDGEVSGAVASFRDVTHYYEIEEMKSDFVSTVTHEFKTPLTSLALNAAMLKEKTEEGEIDVKENDDAVDVIDEIEDDSERLLEMVEGILNMSKMESGQMEMDMQTVDVQELFDTAIGPFWRQAEEQDVILSVADASDCPDVDADPTKISWVISNLVGNALRYTETGGKISIEFDERGTRVVVSVSDTGIGIPEDVQDRIFDRFVQVSDPEHSAGGTGLGLAICREIIRAHGERIWVESKEGEGTTFSFTLKKVKN